MMNRKNTVHCNREYSKYGIAFLCGGARQARKKRYLREQEYIFTKI